MALGFTGLRPAEMLGLIWADIHDGAMYIKRSAWRGQISDGGKVKRAKRVVPFGPFITRID
jgi:integrase